MDSTSSTVKDRTPSASASATSTSKAIKALAPSNGSWDGIERRDGNDRRKENTINQSRLDGRSKRDRRATKISYQI
ncbi:hypothetical protein ACFSJY_08035 [Thalassotalea euphylliae]|uniref:hypothetical protein n=1 Tax=Thalassotalea euphylliae TaxID=1655234 RepID=UPI00363944C8